MNIGFDAKRAFFNRSGLGNYSRSIIQLLNKYYPDNKYFLYTPKISNKIDFIDSPNVKIRQPKGWIYRLVNAYWRSFKMPVDFQNDKLDLYHGLSNELPFGIKKSNVKSIVTIHDLIFMRYPKLYKKIDRWIYYKKFKTSCSNADTVVATSNQTKNDLIEFLNVDEKKIRVVYQGCSPIFYQNKSDEEKHKIREKYNLPSNFLLYVGTVEERKNALSIVKALHKGNIDVPLIIAGKQTPYIEKIKQYITQNNVANDIRFLSYLPLEDLPALYQMADAFIFPSIFEGFGIPILEALNSGVPVITSTGSCFRETGGPQSLYVEPGDTESMIKAIKDVMTDRELRERMKQEGLAHARKFRDENIADNMFKVYKETLGDTNLS